MKVKIDPENIINYKNKIKNLKNDLNIKQSEISKLLENIKKNNSNLINYYYIAITNEYLDKVKIYCNMNKISEKYLHKKNDDFLNDARKSYFNSLINLEKVIGSDIDNGLNENQEILNTISKMNSKRIFNLMNKFQNMLEEITESYGPNSKYTWAFVDMDARYAAIYKNILNWRVILINDPRDSYFPENTALLRNCKQKIQDVSNRLREKYFLSTKELSDIKLAILYQEALTKITILIDAKEETEIAKKTIDSWKAIVKREEEINKRKKKKKNI